MAAAYAEGSYGSSLLLLLVVVVLPLSAIVGAASTPARTLRAAHSSKAPWVLLPFFSGFVAAVIHWTLTYPRLRAARRTGLE